ncbi:MAG: NUDIX hydrolase [Lachnospiraceae bacterium]|nr:NUDIX hydrolase [Lachnospiraceae bacterium]
MGKYKPCCKEEQDFLREYNPSQFSPIAITVDAVIFGIEKDNVDNYRKLDEQSIKVLLVKRDDYPYKDCYSLPGGFVLEGETLEDSLRRTLKNKTGLTNVYSEQLYTYGEVDRDPRMRVISCAYISLLDTQKAKIKNAIWMNLDCIKELRMAFDHGNIIEEAIKRLRGKINYTDIVFHMMSEEFTISELQQVYEKILGEKLLAPAFRRTISDKLEDTGKMTGNAGHRPSRLFRYKK